jgi:hypothetical protein
VLSAVQQSACISLTYVLERGAQITCVPNLIAEHAAKMRASSYRAVKRPLSRSRAHPQRRPIRRTAGRPCSWKRRQLRYCGHSRSLAQPSEMHDRIGDAQWHDAHGCHAAQRNAVQPLRPDADQLLAGQNAKGPAVASVGQLLTRWRLVVGLVRSVRFDEVALQFHGHMLRACTVGPIVTGVEMDDRNIALARIQAIARLGQSSETVAEMPCEARPGYIGSALLIVRVTLSGS